MRTQRYRSYGQFLKEKFGRRVYKVSVDGGLSCPNRDGTVGTGGCTYCNNDSFRPASASRLKSIAEQASGGIDYLKKRYGAEKFIIYFQAFSNTHAPLQKLIPLYESAVNHPDVIGLSVGTRPDCIDGDKIAWFEKLARTYFVTLEYGLQSMHDSTLARVNRGHDFRSWLDAMRNTRNRGIRLCAHLILGFPWESRKEMLAAAGVLNDSGVDFLKLHHFHIVRNTKLADEHREQPFRLLGAEEYADLAVDFLELLNPAIFIERLFGFAPADQLIAPLWGKSKSEIRRLIEERLIARNTFQGRYFRS